MVTGHCPGRVPPFGHPWINAYLQLPMAFRSLSRPSSAISALASTLRSSSLDLAFDRFPVPKTIETDSRSPDLCPLRFRLLTGFVRLPLRGVSVSSLCSFQGAFEASCDPSKRYSEEFEI